LKTTKEIINIIAKNIATEDFLNIKYIFSKIIQ
jgi:hypothetical protein